MLVRFHSGARIHSRARRPTALTTPACCRGAAPSSGSGGFAFAFVVLVLFVIGILGSAGYTVVQNEASLALGTDDAMEASAVARAGLARYFGEHLGIPEDTVEYAIGTGTATITTRYLAEADPVNEVDLYLVSSTGSVTDPRYPDSPATRTVRQYAHLQREPISRDGVLQTSYSSVSLRFAYYIDGNDYSDGRCAESGEDVYGVAHRGSVSQTAWGGNGTVDGSPAGSSRVYTTQAEFANAVGLRWDVLTDPDFPIEYDGSFPTFWSLPADEYPVIRTSADFTAASSHSGRGVLIVPGNLNISSGFQWDGIILAGSVSDLSWRWWYLTGMVILGMNGTDTSFTWTGWPNLYYDVCSAIAASNALAWFDPVEGSAWEEG